MVNPNPRSAPRPDTAGAPPGPTRDTRFDRRRAWLVAALIVAFMLINHADKAVLGLAAVPIMDELHLSNSTYGLVSSSFALLFSLSGLVVGFLSARISSRMLLLTLAAVWALAQLPVLVVASVPTLVAGRVLLGAAEGPAAPMSMHALYKWFPEDRRGLPSALQISGAALATLIATPVLTWLITAFGWRSAFAALAVAGVVWCLLWWRAGHDGPYGHRSAHGAAPASAPASGAAGASATPSASAPASGPGRPDRLPYRRLLLTGTVVGSIAGAFGASWALSLSQAWLPAYLRTQLGMSPGHAAALISGVSAFSFVLLLAVSPMVDALRRRGVSSRWAAGAPQGIAVAVAALAMAGLAVAEGRMPLLVLIPLAFGAHAITFPLHYMTAAAVVPSAQRGAVFGIVAATGTLPGLIAPYLTGHLLDAASSPAAGYTRAFLLSAAVMLVCAVVALVAIRPERDARRLGAGRAGPGEGVPAQAGGSKPLAQ
ncbi:MFS transporter [Streptomyces mexicanus]|uniref:MFS transporter n=1 Tax=Streptomyces mexicanus TaxID=178566 RepID=UPI0031E97D4A